MHRRLIGRERCGPWKEDEIRSDVVPHGLPFDVARHRWPAGRGAPQFGWEAPRAVPREVTISDRPAKLRALGNAVVPQCALVVGRVLIALMTEADGL